MKTMNLCRIVIQQAQRQSSRHLISIVPYLLDLYLKTFYICKFSMLKKKLTLSQQILILLLVFHYDKIYKKFPLKFLLPQQLLHFMVLLNSIYF